MLQLENVKKYYSSFLALDIPVYSIEDGCWWLLGENGSGKTTLLKIIAGLHPFDGNISLAADCSIKKQRQKFLRLINYAEAEPLYPSFLTPKDLVRLYCSTKKGSEDEAKEMLLQLNMLDAYTKPFATFSSGMIKKVSLVLAFIGNAKWILLDEPLITIDVNAVKTITGIINEKINAGVSFIITSHQPINETELAFSGRLIVADKTLKSI